MNALKGIQDYQNYVDCLRQLHQLFRSGEGESETADLLRDRMDDYWSKLDPDQITRVCQISADLDTLNEDQVEVPEMPAATVANEIATALAQSDTIKVLKLLRQSPNAFPKHAAHYMRFAAYRDLGEDDIALEFGYAALELMPGERRYLQAIIVYLTMLGRYEDALSIAEQYSTATDVDWELEILKGCLLFQTTRRLQADAKVETCKRVIAMLVPALTLSRATNRAPDESVCQGFLTLAFAYDAIGDLKSALNTLGELLTLDPNNAEAFAWRGLLNRNTDSNSASEDFERAVEFHCETTAMPYISVAINRLHRNFDREALDVSLAGLRVANNIPLQAQLLQWSAIAMHKLGYPMNAIEERFRHAVALDPENTMIRHNAQVFRATAAASTQTNAEFTVHDEAQFGAIDARRSQLGLMQKRPVVLAG